MASVNKVILIGNLTRNPELRRTPKGTAITEIGIAINRVWTDERGEKKEDVTFVDVTLWARLAELAEQYLTKGRSVYIEGRLQLDQWEDRETGQKRSKLRVVGETMQFLGSKDGGSSDQSRPVNSSSSRPASRPANRSSDPDLDTEPDDIPF